MKITSGQKIKTGIFVTIAFAFLLAVIFLIGKEKNLFSKTFTVYAHFKNVSGLQEGNFVRFAGINVGTVDEISIVNDTTVRISLVLNNKVKPYIKTDGAAHIGSDGLMGDKLIQISSGTDSGTVVKPGGQIKSVNPVEMEKIVGKFTRIADNAESDL